MTILTSPTDIDLHDLSASLDAPFATVTTTQVADARRHLAKAGATELEAMLGIDAQGLADGIARGYWTQVSA